MMSFRDSLESIIITDSTTGAILRVIKDKDFDDDITLEIVNREFKKDYKNNRHGIHIRYGIEP